MIITPITLTLYPNTAINYPLDNFLPIETNKEIQLNLSNLIFSYINGLSNFPIVSVIINWGDDSQDILNFQAQLIYNNNWLQNIGSHTYSNKDGPNIINIILVDACGTNFILNIQTEIVKQSIYNLDFELDIKKSAFTASNSSVVFSYTSQNSEDNNTSLTSILT